ncbi:AAA family ATPase [Bradyrhizobium sp. MOS003]|uniref:AAA family ATPase n=1 Tax=Bradyrhizobium sp. MOS003 TaxID=2133946 RepID=UPI001314E00C|nr:AAA family ATPase [Bradyrhizobium sp. MOS003]
MTLRTLAASVRPLSEVFAGIAHGGGGFSQLARSHSGGEADDDHDIASDGGGSPLHTTSRFLPDTAAAALLLGRAFENARPVLAKMLDRDSIVVIQVPHPDLADPIRRFLRLLLPRDIRLIDGNELTGFNATWVANTAIVFSEGTKSKVSSEKDDAAAVATTVRLHCPIIGIATPFGRLPKPLVRLAEHRVIVPSFDADIVADVIEAVTAARPATVDASMASRVGIVDLTIAVRSDIGAERSLERLQRLVDPKHIYDIPSLSELSGMGAAKTYVMEVVDSMRAYLAGRPWSECPHGLLVSGPPGTGKTSLMRSLARELPGVHFIATSYAQFQSHKTGHLGDVTSCIRATFAEALQRRPSIIYIDECDAIPARHSGKDSSWWNAIVATLLECMQGFEQTEGVFLCASCNDPDRLDPALIRAGRLDHHIRIELPDIEGLIGIFRTHLRTDCVGIDLREAAVAARGHTGADVEKWIRMARHAARTAGRKLVLADVLQAVRNGKPNLPQDLRRCIAYHEAGHAISHLALGTAIPTSLSIGDDGGFSESAPEQLQLPTQDYLERFLITSLAGRAAEELKFGEATTGSGGTSAKCDLVRATSLALRIESAYGYGHTGLVTLSEDEVTDSDLLMNGPLRLATNETLKRAYAKSLALLKHNSRSLHALAEALFAAGYLDQSEIAAVIAANPLVPAAALTRETTSPSLD